jgi:hypothetical protein
MVSYKLLSFNTNNYKLKPQFIILLLERVKVI